MAAIVTLQRGNLDAYAPSTAAIYEAIQKGGCRNSFHTESQTFVLPEAPDFLLAGDFNLDGFRDVLAAANGGHLYLMTGRGEWRSRCA